MNLNATLLGQMIAFALFVWFCWKFVWPPLLAELEDRAKKLKEEATSEYVDAITNFILGVSDRSFLTPGDL